MATAQTGQPTLHSIAPRFAVGKLEQALAFYGHLGFVTTYQDEGFARHSNEMGSICISTLQKSHPNAIRCAGLG
jgi:hypothetical protein